jgi:hypothetical protein
MRTPHMSRGPAGRHRSQLFPLETARRRGLLQRLILPRREAADKLSLRRDVVYSIRRRQGTKQRLMKLPAVRSGKPIQQVAPLAKGEV